MPGDLLLKTLANSGGHMPNVNIEYNWSSIMAWAGDVNAALAGDAITMQSITPDAVAGTLKFTLSDGSSYTVTIPLKAPFRPMGAWVTGTDYKFGDIYSNAGSSYLVLLDHTSTTVVADLAAAKTMVLASAAVATPPVITFSALGSAAVADRVIGIAPVPVGCNLVATYPLLVTLATPSDAGNPTFHIVVKKRTALGVVSTLDTINVAAGVKSTFKGINAAFSAGDTLLVYATDATGITSASDIGVSVILVPA